MSIEDTRTEHDSLGEVQVPAAALWAAQTQRALDNFDIGGTPFPLEVVHQIANVKVAAARVNGAHTGVPAVDEPTAAAIAEAAAAVASGAHDDAFPLDVLQTGSGTSSNMNVNEVVAHLAAEALGHPVHPNDQVNASQSSNDVVPTAIRLATAVALDEVEASLHHLAGELRAKGQEFADVVKMGRTHLMDAAPVLLGWEFDGWAAVMDNAARIAADARPALLNVPLGGTAVGNGVNVPEGWVADVLTELSDVTGMSLGGTDHAFVSQAGHEDLVVASGALRATATGLVKVANDLRLLASGPFGGIGEIVLPTLQPGSSIMPGKVNPVICEAVVQAGYRVIGNDAAVALGAAAGTLELNTTMPLLAWCLLESAGLVSRSAASLADRCVRGIVADVARSAQLAGRSPALVTGLVPLIGYETAAKAAKLMMNKGLGVVEALAAIGVTEATVPGLAAAVDPANLARGNG
ncbi:MAG: class II fumarate hydratase [Acidimicrobiales bacterium]